MRINVVFHELDSVFEVDFAEQNDEFQVEFKDLYFTEMSRVDYTGPYDVTPTARTQTLETKEKVMLENVEISAIPVYEVSNNSGGTTIYIGNEV